MTTPGSNAGIYFHTKYQDEGWPKQGYECQVNITHHDPKKTSSLYGVVNVDDPGLVDNVWCTQEICGSRSWIRTELPSRHALRWVTCRSR
ncbi:hypothetical protein Pla100_02050 [Neorhodopirellula pilleata]|uniref:3-keto-alpha-glucoside-1,2-lyase/3-keto-2-hydroxy-glucal hydratase domain-containing protein n=1 Tax=Neorhodopirellula pilleata TaxID=2714738 RepID=A0A5C6AUY3_9BACT|nr:hypothetical protein Pla100_02050 [Neorhodopirellula pilleata]